MGKFIGATGLLYLWNKIKSLIPTKVSDLENDSGFTSNVGTITGVTMNGASKGTSGVVNLGTVLTEHQTIYESKINWGNTGISGSVTPMGASLSSEHSANRIAYLNPAAIQIEYTTNGGSSWSDSGYSDGEKTWLCTGNQSIVIGQSKSSYSSATALTTNHWTRITLTGQNGTNTYVYTAPRKLLVNMSTALGVECLVECKTGVSGASWQTFGTYSVSGWSGWNDIPLVLSTFGGGTSQTGNNWYLRFTFKITSTRTDNYKGFAQVLGLRLFGANDWTSASSANNKGLFSSTGHLYSYDVGANAIFPSQVQATSFKKAGGTSSQFLKADGSVDSNTYLTTTSASNTYLPLAGGTMTGCITTSRGMLLKTSLTPEGSGTGHAIGVVAKLNDDTSVGGLGFLFAKSGTTVSLTGIGLAVNPTWWIAADGLFITKNDITWQGNSLLTTNSDYVTGTTTQTISGTKTFSANVTANGFVKTGGTSSQFLKADGSVDNNTYLTSFTETDPTVPAWAKASTKPSYTASEVGALPDDTQLFSGDYNDLTNKPTIPSAVTESTVSGWGFTKNTGTVTYTEDT